MSADKKVFILVPGRPDIRQRCAEFVLHEAPDESAVRIGPQTRSLEQNSKQWPYLEGFSRQLKWPVNGEMVKLEPEEFKDILTAAFYGETVRLAMGLNGGVVMLGKRTREFTKPQFAEWMAFLKATAAQRGIEPVYATPPKEPAE